MDEIFERVSVRRFTPEPVGAEDEERLLRAAMAAPSARNQQPWEFYVVTSPSVLHELSACSPYAGCLSGAPLGIAVCSRRDCAVPEYAEIDCSAATENLLLEAVSLGLGAVWLGIAPRRERMGAVREALGIPDDLEPFALVACGHPAEGRPQEDRFDERRVHVVR